MKKKMLELIYSIIIRPILKVIIGVKFENKKALQQNKQFIIVANHNSHFDALSLMAALPKGQLANTHTIAAEDYFGKNWMGRILVKFIFNAVFIHRNRAENEPSAIEQLEEIIKSGKSLILFPEGSRGTPGEISDFKKGIAVLLKHYPEVHYIPTFLEGFEQVLPKGSNLILPMNCKVKFGEPAKITSTKIEEILQSVRKSILSLRPVSKKYLTKIPNVSLKLS